MVENTPLWAVNAAKQAGLDSPQFDMGQLFLAAHCKDDEMFKAMVARRLDREPLQYILGEWDFFNLRLQVGKGVLCPRGDTEFVVEQALLHGPFEQVLDLCSGSGCIALAIATANKSAQVTAVENSPQAFAYLQKNIDTYGDHRVHAVLDNVFDYQQHTKGGFDLIICNPPYLTQDEMEHLSPETAAEPPQALLAEENGLAFYRHIATAYQSKLVPNGILAFEIGYTQGQAVQQILQNCGYEHITLKKDYGGNDRFVMGRTKSV